MPLPTALQLTYKTVWQIPNETVKKDTLELWRRYNALPEGQEEDRLKLVCVVAYNNKDHDQLVGVSTILIEYCHTVQAKIALFRCLVHEEYRRSGVATELAVRCKGVMAAWSTTHPAANLAGFGTIVESPHLTRLTTRPIWPRTGMILVGHTQRGLQIRLVWFEHAVLPSVLKKR